MSKKLSRFYRISIRIVLILLLINILVKAIIWSSAFKKFPTESSKQYAVIINAYPNGLTHRYTTELRKNIFNKADYLLTAAFITLFVVLTIKLIKVPEIFKEDD